MTGNIGVAWWIIYIGVPLWNWFFLKDEKNVAKMSESKFMHSNKFLVPLYVYLFTQSLVWIYCLIIFSSKSTINHWIFDKKPKGWMECLHFFMTFGYFLGINGVVGHELIH